MKWRQRYNGDDDANFQMQIAIAIYVNAFYKQITTRFKNKKQYDVISTKFIYDVPLFCDYAFMRLNLFSFYDRFVVVFLLI